MEKYREKLKRETGLLLIGALVLIAVQLYVVIQVAPAMEDSHWYSMWSGFIAGAAGGVTALFIAGIVINILALRSETRLKKLYAKANDERQAKIISSAQAAALQTILIVGIVAVIVAGYFNPTVSLTILACVFLSSLITAGFKIYYSRKY
ncbi:MAG: hypothetical protein Q4F17_03685 [Eubacteriales bacterium]|nr:hypothetical protein [Eubacteriales bacterium]